MPNLKLTYFNAAGRAEPVRIALFMAGAPFEDHRLNFQEFMGLKAEGAFPLGSVPVLQVDGVKFPQTAAMLRYAARLGDTGLYPTDAVKALAVDSVLDTFNDTLSNLLTPSFYERDPAKKLELRAAFADGPMKVVFRHAEELLASSGGPFVLGATMSIADLVLAQQVLAIRGGNLDGITTDHLAPYPHLNALTDAYLAEPRIVAYMAKS